MTAWTTISSLLVAVGAKPFATTMQALRDNPIAIAEGASGAPRVQGIALGSVYAGKSSVGSTTSPVVFLGLDGAKTLYIPILAITTTTRTLQVSYSNNNGATWGSYQTILTTSVDYNGPLVINIVTGGIDGLGLASVSTTPVTGCNAIRFRWDASGGSFSLAVMCFVIGGL